MGRTWLGLNPTQFFSVGLVAVAAMIFSACTSKGQIDDLINSSISSASENATVKVNSGNASTTVLSGACDNEGATIAISGAAFGTTKCQNGQWVVTVDASQAPDGPIQFVATLTMENGTTVSTVLNGTKKTTQPIVTITTLASSVITATNQTAFTFAGTCSEAAKPVIISSGAFSDSATCSGGTWTKNLNIASLAEGNISFNVKQTDEVGNTTTAYQTQTKDTVAPANGSTSMTGAPTGISSVTTLNVTVTGSGDATHYMYKVGLAASTDCSVQTGYGTETAIANPITASISGLADGSVKLCAITRDTNGNYQSPSQAASATWTKDALSPSVVISSSHSSPTNANPMIFTVTFNESVTGFVVGDITVGNGTKQNFSGSGTTYTFEVIPTAPGAVTVDIAAAVAQDAGSNNNTAATQYSRTYDNTQPTVTISSTATASTNISPIPFTVTFSKSVTGFDAGDISSSNGLVTNFAGSGATYTFDVTPITHTAVNINVAASVAQDAAGNNNTAATQYTRSYDPDQPTVVISAAQTSPTNAATINMTVTFNEAVSNFVIGDITVVNGTKGALSGGPTVYTFDITPTANSTVTVDVAAGVASDAATNTNTAATQFSIAHDNQAPTLSGLSNDTTPTKSKTWSWGCSETCTYRYVVDTTSNTAPSGAYAATATASQTTGTNTYYIHVEAKDSAGNTAVGHYSAILDNTAPTAGTINDGNYLNSLTSSPNISWSGFSDNIAIHHYEYAIGTASAGFDVLNWTNNSTTLNVTAGSLSLTTNTTYFASVRAFDEAGNSVEVNGNGWIADTTTPTTPGSVNDGATYSSITNSPTVSWSASTDTSGSGIAYYEMAIGTTSGASNTKTWTNVGTGTSGSVGSMSLTSGSTYYASVRAVDNAGNVSNPVGLGDGWTAQNPLSPDSYYYMSVLHHHFDGADNDNGYMDFSSNAMVFSAGGNTSVSGNGRFGGGAYFDGNGDYLNTSDHTGFDFGSGDFTIETWINLDSDAGAYAYVGGQSQNNLPAGSGVSWLIRTADSAAMVGFRSGADGSQVIVMNFPNTGASLKGSWNHIALSRQGSTFRYFINGALISTATSSVAIADPSFNFHIGATSDSAQYPLKGYIDEYRVSKGIARYTTAFTPSASPFTTDVNTSTLLHFDSMADKSAAQNLTQMVGGAKISTAQSKFGGSSANFNGSSRILIPDATHLEPGNGDFTVEAWVYAPNVTTGQTPFAKCLSWNVDISSGNVMFYGSVSSPWNMFSGVSGGAISANTWTHIAISRVGTSVKGFVNGVGTTLATSGSAFLDNAQPISLGSDCNPSWYFTGYIDEFRMTKGVGRYTSNFTPSTLGFADYQASPFVITPTSSAPAGGVTAYVYGNNFDSTTAVTIDGASCPVTSRGPTRVGCTVPAGSSGYKNVVITTTGQTTETLTNGFAYGCASPDVQTFNSSGTWTKPSCAVTTTVQCWGGGGGGAYSGGGGGAYNTMTAAASTFSGTVSVTIGAGGSPSGYYGNAGNGGNTTFGGYLTAYGGGGGTGAVSYGFNGIGGGGGGIAGAGASGASGGAGGAGISGVGVGGAGGNASNTSGGGGGGASPGINGASGSAANAGGSNGGAGGGGGGGYIGSGSVGSPGVGQNGGASGSYAGFGGCGGAANAAAPGGGGAGCNDGSNGGAGKCIVTSN